MKILFLCGQNPSYMRNAVILKGLKNVGFDVIECTSSSSSYIYRYPEILKKFLLNKGKEFDIIYIGYFGQPLVPICKAFSKKPIVFDAFLSTYDTLCFDRSIFRPQSINGKLAYYLDKCSCQLSDIVLLDTEAHIEYFRKTFNLKEKNFFRIYMGADESIFYPRDVPKDRSSFTIFYYSSYHPLHGIDHIVRAAKKLENYGNIKFNIVGNGMEYKKILDLAQNLKVSNINFLDRIPFNEFYTRIVQDIAKSDICLGGHFSSIDKAKRVIAEKTFEFAAMKKPIILGDNPANRELFKNKKNCILVEHANPDSLSDAILELKEDDYLRNKIAENGYSTYRDNCSINKIGLNIKEIVETYFGS